MSRTGERRSTAGSHARARKGPRWHWLAICAALLLASTWWLALPRNEIAEPAPLLEPAPEEEPAARPIEPATADERIRVEVEPVPEPAPPPLTELPLPAGALTELTELQESGIVRLLEGTASQCQERARAVDQRTLEGQLEYLSEARSAAKHTAAAEVVRRGGAWAFPTENSEQQNAAKRLVPMGWDYLTVGTAAPTSDGETIHLVIPIDPAVFPEPSALGKRFLTLRLVQQVNAMPEDKRRELVERHLAAVLRVSRADAAYRFPAEVEIDFANSTLRVR